MGEGSNVLKSENMLLIGPRDTTSHIGSIARALKQTIVRPKLNDILSRRDALTLEHHEFLDVGRDS